MLVGKPGSDGKGMVRSRDVPKLMLRVFETSICKLLRCSGVTWLIKMYQIL